MPFDSPDLNLGDLLREVGSGKIRLPDFQRDWKWDTDRIAGLLASVSLGYPVGVVMLLDVGGPDVQFATQMWVNRQAAVVNDLLEGLRPDRTDGVERRGFEWHHQRNLNDPA